MSAFHTSSVRQFFLFWEVNTAQPHYNAILSTFVLVKLQIQECSPNHFLYPELLSFCQNAKEEGPPWAGCQRCCRGLLKWLLLASREQLHPITDSKQMVTCGDKNCDVIKPLICDFTLYFQSFQVMLPVWCSSLPPRPHFSSFGYVFLGLTLKPCFWQKTSLYCLPIFVLDGSS